MQKRYDQYLCKIAPHLFADRYGRMESTCMCWGFGCGDGWYKLLKEVALKLEPLIVEAIKKDPKGWKLGAYRAVQVKEKYGTLRFYLSSGTDEMYAIIEIAESQSSVTCEQCGKAGKVRGRFWFYTRCAKCWKRMNND